MPHAVIEYSANIASQMDASQLVALVHGKMLDCEIFNKPDIKTRAYEATHYAVGESGRDGGFVHVTIALLAGRPVEKRQQLSQSLLAALVDALPGVDQLTVDLREMERETFSKRQAIIPK